MTSDLSGSTTEPVKRKISVHVVSARIASAHGQVRGERRLLVDERRRLPGHARGGQLGRARCRTSCCERPARPFVARQEVEPPEARRDLAGPAARAAGARRGCEARDAAARGGAAADRRDRRVAAADAVAVERLGDLPCSSPTTAASSRRRRRSGRRGRDREHDEHRCRHGRDPARAAASPTRRAAPSGRPRAAAAAAAARARRSAGRASRGTPAAARARRCPAESATSTPPRPIE